MRATRALLRRRVPLTRTRAALLAPVQPTPRQSHLSEIGKPLASKAHREGVAARCPAPAVPHSVEKALALIAHDARRLRAVEVPRVQTATLHQAQPLSRRPSVPGIGKIVRLVWLYAMPEMAHCPRGQDGGSSCRLVTCAKESAGQHAGKSGATIGNASLTGACADAAVLWLRTTPAGPQSLPRLEHQPGQGKALTIFAHQ